MVGGARGESVADENQSVEGQTDSVLPFAVEELGIRGRVAYFGSTTNNILNRHDYPEPVCRLLAEAIVLTSLLAASIKLTGRLILQTQSDGPVSLMVVDFKAPGNVRAYTRFDETFFEKARKSVDSDKQSLLGKGHLAMTIDQGSGKQKYQGLVELDGESLETIAHRYFEQSEQIPTIVRLAVGEVITKEGSETSHVWRAGGIIAQFLPENTENRGNRDFNPEFNIEGLQVSARDEDEAWQEAKALIQTTEDVELTDTEMNAEKLLFRLFHNREVRIFQPQSVGDKCHCDNQSVRSMLMNFKPEERREMVVEGRISVTCEFCSSTYDFDSADFTD